MKKKIINYKLFNSASSINDIISYEIKKNIFKKRYNLTGERSSNGEIEIYNAVSLVVTKPNLGPLVKLNLKCVNSKSDENQSNLKVERVNGFTFYAHYWISIIVTVIAFVVAISEFWIEGFEQTELIFLPLFGIGFHFVVRLIANVTTENLIFKVEKMLKKERIKYVKL